MNAIVEVLRSSPLRKIAGSHVAALSLVCLGGSLAGCASSDGWRSVAAEPLAIESARYSGLTTRQQKLEFLGGVVMDSERKCSDFLNRLVLEETGINAGTDIASTVFSALATAVTPPGTKSAFSAAATIATGSKTAIDADVFNKAAIADFATAIQKTYYADVQKYTDALPNLTDTQDAPLVVSNELAKLESYHAECGLAPAESAIQAKLGTPPQQTSPAAASPAAKEMAAPAAPAGRFTGAERRTTHKGEQPMLRQPATQSALVGRGSW